MLKSWRLGTAITGSGRRRRSGVNWEFWSKRGLSQESAPTTQGTAAPTQGVAPLPTNRPADPAVHSSEPLGEDADAAAIAATASKPPPPRSQVVDPPKPPRFSPKLEHTEVGLPSEPNTHQKRYLSNSNQPANPPAQTLVDVSCTGLDGSPWPDNEEEGMKAQRKAQEEDDKEYFKDHKASPLSEVEFVDSRKPITQATDHGPDSPIVGYYGGDTGVIVWRPEQLDTAEEALRRGVEIFLRNKMRGDPDSPHGRVLRALCGENW